MKENKIRGELYKILKTEILVSNRPSIVEHSIPYLSVTDTFVPLASDATLVWVPWNEFKPPSVEFLYATNRTLFQWVHYEARPKICIFCDAGTHRSVTVFGFFLKTYFKQHKGAGKLINSDYHQEPLSYASKYMNNNPELMLLSHFMGLDHLGRLDQISTDIKGLVERHFGKQA